MSSDFLIRKPNRLKFYDYTQTGIYFVTVCIEGKRNLLGRVVNEQMIKNDIGDLVEKWWLKTADKFPQILLDEYVVMPNHFHGIIHIPVGDDPCVVPSSSKNVVPSSSKNVVSSLNIKIISNIVSDSTPNVNFVSTQISIPIVLQWFKTMSTNEYLRHMRSRHGLGHVGKFWQRSYHDRIIRNETELFRIREYILNNPSNWDSDSLV